MTTVDEQDRGGSLGARIASAERALGQLGASPWFAYASLLLVQAKVIWAIWQYRDLPSGDTADYFVKSSNFALHLDLTPIWSPLYLAYWGVLQRLIHDAYAVTIVHRVLIVFALSLLVLAILRRLLSPGIAWALAVWWAVLPTYFDGQVEVHMFSAAVLLLAVLVALPRSTLVTRSLVFSILLISTLLLRNEVVVALVFWIAAWGWFEFRSWRRGEPSAQPRRIALAFVLPVVVAAALTAATFFSWTHRANVLREARAKTENNLCQAYAFGYKQRKHDFHRSPWTQCGSLMRRDFGKPRLSFTSAVAANPGAMLDHSLWNARLIPYGLQLLLFDKTSGPPQMNPDYVAVETGSRQALVGSLLVLAVVISGGILLWRRRRYAWEKWIRQRVWGWIALGALGAVSVTVMITERPRPEYLIPFAALLFAVVGTCAMAIAERLPALGRLRALVPVAAVVLVAALPSHYDANYSNAQSGVGRPIHDAVVRLEPFRDLLSARSIRLLAPNAKQICDYVGRDQPCKPAPGDLGTLAARPRTRGAGPESRRSADYVYLPGADIALQSTRLAVRRLREHGWLLVAHGSGLERWLFLADPRARPAHA